MKRISTLLVAAAMVFGSMGAAQAVEVKVKGTFDFTYGYGVNVDFAKDQAGKNERDDFIAKQRVRTQINFITSENLQGVVMFEIGNLDWGRGGKVGQGSGGDLGADGVNVETKRAYLDWLVPNTDLAIRMGIQGLALPSATGFGSPVFNDDVAAITASYQFNDMFGLTAFWARPYDAYAYDGSDGNETKLDDETDMWGVIAPVTGEGWSATPWAVLANIGSQSGMVEKMFGKSGSSNITNRAGAADSSLGWWLGTGFELTMFDPITFAADLMYGQVKGIEGITAKLDDNLDVAGWFFDARVDYKMDWATAGIFGWYGSGDNGDDDKVGRIPSFNTSSGFAPTTFGFDGGYALSDTAIISQTGTGTWGLGAQLADMSFVEDLKHTLRVTYYRGTNDEDAKGVRYNNDKIYMTTEDSAWEVNLDSKYQIYENLAAVVELGYIHLDLDENHAQYADRDNAWKAQVSFKYEF